MKMTEYSSALLRERYYRMEHHSGLPIYVFPKKLTTAYALFAVNYGSMDNAFSRSEGESPISVPDGIAHFLEHKLFENEDGSDSFARFAALGADANAYTSYDRTAYLFSATEGFDEALEELLRFVTHPHFTDASVQKEQGIIAEEIRMYEDSPWERSFRILLESMYESSPVRINVCGSEESIAAITPALLYDCYHTFYNPANMILAVCGDVTPEQVMAVANRALPTDFLPKKVLRAPFSERREVVRSYAEDTMQVAKPIFCIGIKDPEVQSDPVLRMRRDFCMALLDEILFSRAGEFYNGLFERGILTPSFGFGYSCSDRFAFHCLSGESDTPETVLNELKAYLARVRREGIDPEAFERCRRVMYADEICAYDSSEEIANRLLSFAMDGVDMFSCPDLLQSIKKEELESLLGTAFDDAYFSMTVIRPTNPKGE